MKRTFLLSVVSMVAVSTAVSAPQVSNVAFTQDEFSRKVAISYRLAGEPGIVTFDIRTNGVSIGAANITHAWGDVNKLVGVSDSRVIYWAPDKSWPGHEITDGSVTAVVTAWATNAPPDYMVIGLVEPYPVNYYESVSQIPKGVTNDDYKTTSLVMRRIPAKGVTWRMGSPSSEVGHGSDETPHMVSLSDDYFMGIYELTQKQFQLVNGGAWNAKFKGDKLPMETIRYSDIRGYTAGVAYPSSEDVDSGSFIYTIRAKIGFQFDFPTEAQWEYACRAGCGTGLYNGQDLASSGKVLDANAAQLAWFGDENTGAVGGNSTNITHEVGLKEPNAWGLYDMLGNVDEYCLDYYGNYAVVAEGDSVVDPRGADTPTDSDNRRVIRGGNWWYGASWCRAASRHSQRQQYTGDTIGFRLVCPTGTR